MTDAAEILAACDRLIESAADSVNDYTWLIDGVEYHKGNDILLVATAARRAIEVVEAAQRLITLSSGKRYDAIRDEERCVGCDSYFFRSGASNPAARAARNHAPDCLWQALVTALSAATHDRPRDGAREDEEWGPDSAQQTLERGPR